MGRLLFHTPDGPVFWSPDELALLREEWDGRLEATASDGAVGHRPGPLPRLPGLHELSPGVLVNPAHAARVGDELHLPGGWTLPFAQLPPAVPREPEGPDTVVALARREGRWTWLTMGGSAPCELPVQEALLRERALVPVGDAFVKPSAVRALRRARDDVFVDLAAGHVVKANRKTLEVLTAALDLPWPDTLAAVPPRHRIAYERGVRDWPVELAYTDDAELRGRYSEDPVRMVDHVVWETFRLRQRGAGESHGRSPRGLLYAPLKPVAVRSGVIQHEVQELEEPFHVPLPLQAAWAASHPEYRAVAGGWSFARLATVLQERLDLFIGEWRYFTYADLGFLDHGQGNRAIGGARPAVVLVVEKSSLEWEARVVASMFGVSMLILGGAPTWIGTEFFARSLGASTPLRLVSYCDFDPYGWGFPVFFHTQLARYGVAVEGLVRLVKAERFTQQERDLLAIPLSTSPRHRELIEQWIAETGGVGGRPLGLAADYLRPVQRVVAAFLEETGLEPVMSLEEAIRCSS